MRQAPPSPAEFMATVAHVGGGNTLWAARYSEEIRDLLWRRSSRDPRSTQKHLGPSELGSPCDREIVSKMTGQKITNHLGPWWASWIGRACHDKMANELETENQLNGDSRWWPEKKVVPHPDYPGTSDAYDARWAAVIDHKFLAEEPLSGIMRDGPSIQYEIQLLLYGQGWISKGYKVDRYVLIAYPRTKSTLTTLYVWERPWSPDDSAIVAAVLELTAYRKALAQEVLAGRLHIEDVPRKPSDKYCHFCPVYRPEAARTGGPGCPGHTVPVT